MVEIGTQPRPPRKRVLVSKRITVPGNLRRACDEFNSGLHFECHETLEEIWQEEHGPVRNLYKGLIQIAAAFVHIDRNNAKGAGRLLATGIGYLEPYVTTGAMGFDVDGIVKSAERAKRELERLGHERLDEFDPRLAPVFRWDPRRVEAEAIRWNAWGFDEEGQAASMEITVVE